MSKRKKPQEPEEPQEPKKIEDLLFDDAEQLLIKSLTNQVYESKPVIKNPILNSPFFSFMKKHKDYLTKFRRQMFAYSEGIKNSYDLLDYLSSALSIQRSLLKQYGWADHIFEAFNPDYDYLYSTLNSFIDSDLSKEQQQEIIDAEMYNFFLDQNFLREFIFSRLPGYSEYFFLDSRNEEALKKAKTVFEEVQQSPSRENVDELLNVLKYYTTYNNNERNIYRFECNILPSDEPGIETFTIQEVLDFCYEQQESFLTPSRSLAHLQKSLKEDDLKTKLVCGGGRPATEACLYCSLYSPDYHLGDFDNLTDKRRNYFFEDESDDNFRLSKSDWLYGSSILEWNEFENKNSHSGSYNSHYLSEYLNVLEELYPILFGILKNKHTRVQFITALDDYEINRFILTDLQKEFHSADIPTILELFNKAFDENLLSGGVETLKFILYLRSFELSFRYYRYELIETYFSNFDNWRGESVPLSYLCKKNDMLDEEDLFEYSPSVYWRPDEIDQIDDELWENIDRNRWENRLNQHERLTFHEYDAMVLEYLGIKPVKPQIKKNSRDNTNNINEIIDISEFVFLSLYGENSPSYEEDIPSLENNSHYSDFAEETTLHSLGYIVGKTGLPDASRRKLINRIIEDGDLSVREIRETIQNSILISKNRRDRKEAIEDWQSDLKYLKENFES